MNSILTTYTRAGIAGLAMAAIFVASGAAAPRTPARSPAERGHTAAAKNRQAGQGGKLVIMSRSGAITVNGADRDTVEVRLDGRPAGSDVEITRDARGTWTIKPSLHLGSGDMVITAPRDVSIQSLHTNNGAIFVTGISGPVSAETNSGDIKVEGTGPASVSTANGEVVMQKIGGDASARSLSGDVVLRDIGGRATASSASGEVSVDRADSCSIHTAGDVRVSDIAGNVGIETKSGTVIATGIKGDLQAKSLSGDLRAQDIGGLVTLVMTSGDVRIIKAGGRVKITAISGDIDLKCVKNSAEVASVSGDITMAVIGGDVNAASNSGDVVLAGPLRPGSRVHLKSTSADVRLELAGEIPGFTATLSSYEGNIQTDFPLKVDAPLQGGPLNRKVIGRFGDGSAEISLDSFSGTVTITKVSPNKHFECK